MYDQMKQHEIHVLYEAGFSVRQIAKKTEIARNTIRRILRQETEDGERSSPLGRPPVASAYESLVQRILDEQGDLPTVEILRRFREHGYSEG